MNHALYSDGIGMLRLHPEETTAGTVYPIKINFDVELDDVELKCLFIQAKGLRDGRIRRKREIELGL